MSKQALNEVVNDLAKQLKNNITTEIKKVNPKSNRARVLADTQTHIYALSKGSILGHLAYQMLVMYDNGDLNIREREKTQIQEAFDKQGKLKDSSVKGIVSTINKVATNLTTQLNNHFNKLAETGPTGGALTEVIKGGKQNPTGTNEVVLFTFKPVNPTRKNKVYGFIADQSRPILKKALKPIMDMVTNPSITEGDIYNIGHMFNSTASTMANLQQIIKLAETLRLSSREISTLKGIITKSANKNTQPLKSYYSEKKLNLNYSRRMILDSKLYSEHEVLVELQSDAFNKKIKHMENEALKEIRKDALAYLASKWPTVKSSPTDPKIVADHVLENTVDALDRALKNKTRFNKPRRTVKAKSKKAPIKVKGSRAKDKKPTVNFLQLERVEEVTTDLTNIQSIINEHLPEYLQKNMGKGRATEVLNWRTGRFGNSAELVNLEKKKGSRSYILQGMITYLRNPYDVFRPGGRLHKEGRDPKLLIDKSIRQILKEKALSKLSFRSGLK